MSKKYKMVTFGGSPTDMFWQFLEPVKKKFIAIVETPNELLYIKNGVVLAVHSEGRHNIIGGGSKDVVKLIFVNTKTPCSVLWGTYDKISYKDWQTSKIVEIGASGEYRFMIKNAQKFYEKMAGTRTRITADELVEMMRIKINSEISEHLADSISEEKIPYDGLDSKKKTLAKSFLPKLNATLDAYGISVEEFLINAFVKPEALKEELNKEADLNLAYDRNKKKLMQDMEIEALKTQKESEIKKFKVSAELDIEKEKYKARGTTYEKERAMDREDIKVKAEATARINESQQENIKIVTDVGASTVCSHCKAVVSVLNKNCSVCGKKLR